MYTSTGTGIDPIGAIQVPGVEVASIVRLESLALDASAGDLTLWAFSQDAKAYVFQLAGNNSKAVTQRTALNDGTIVQTRDIDGDTIMNEAPYYCESPNPISAGTSPLRPDGHFSHVPCFPACDHTYCNYLLDLACSSMITDADGSPTGHGVQFHATFIHHNLPSSLAPCLPSCTHRYCHLLLCADTSTMTTRLTTLHGLPSNSSKTYSSTSASPSSPTKSTEHLFSPSFTPMPEDEGYASAGDEEFAAAGGHFAIYVPPTSGRWSEEVDAEWEPNHLMENGTGVEDGGLGLDLMEMCRCECEFVGNQVQRAGCCE